MSAAWFLYLRMSLGLLFLAAGLSKAWNPRAFHEAVSNFQIVSSTAAPAVAALLVALEILAGLLLVTGYFEWVGGLLAAALLGAFLVALGLNLARGRRNIDCRCFGRPTTSIGWGHVAQNALLLVLTLFIAIFTLPKGALSFGEEIPNVTEGLALTAALLPILGAIYTVVAFLSLQELVSLRGYSARVLGRKP